MTNVQLLFNKPKFQSPGDSRLPLLVIGELPNYVPSAAYEARLDIINSIGDCTVEVVESTLPDGASVSVDNPAKQVVISWPAYQSPQELPIINWNFESGDLTGWKDLRGGSWGVYVYDRNTPGNKDVPYQAPDGNRAACMEGVGRGDHVLESISYPVSSGQPLMARSLWYQGASNKDNNNLWTGVVFYGPGGRSDEVRGDRIHDRTNKRRHFSTVSAVAPAWAESAAVRLIAHRRNGRNRLINVDDVEVSGLVYSSGIGEETVGVYCATLRIRDSSNRAGMWTGCASAAEPVLFSTFSPELSGDDISFDNGMLRAVYSTSNDTPGSSAILEKVLSPSDPNSVGDFCFEFVVRSAVGRVYVGGTFNSIPLWNPDSGAYLRSGAYLAYISNGSDAMVGSGAGGFSWVSPPVTWSIGDVLAYRATTTKVADSLMLTSRWYKNGALIHTINSQSIGTESNDSGFFVGVYEGGTTGGGNGFVVDVETDPGKMQFSYGSSVGWPAD